MRSRRLCVFMCVGLVWLVCLSVEAKNESGVKTILVDCDKGDSINEALEEKANALTIEFSGTCYESVVIRRDNVTIRGVSPGATIVSTNEDPDIYFTGAVVLMGASNIVLEDFTAENGKNGVSLLGGSAAVLRGLTVQDNTVHGVTMLEGSSAFLENCTVLRNLRWGISVWNNSSLEFAPFATTVSNENEVGLIVSNGGVVEGFGVSYVEANGNSSAGFFVQVGGILQGCSVTARLNALGVGMAGGSFFGRGIYLYENAYGVWASHGAVFSSGPGSEIESNSIGISAENGARVFLNGEVSSNSGLGIGLDGVVAEIANTTVTDQVDLSFGTRVNFAGGNNFTGGISCDDTVLVRGDVSCPEPESASATSAKIERKLPEWLKEIGPFEMEEIANQ